MEQYETAKNIAQKYMRITETDMQANLGTFASMIQELEKSTSTTDPMINREIKSLKQKLDKEYTSSINNQSMKHIAQDFLEKITKYN